MKKSQLRVLALASIATLALASCSSATPSTSASPGASGGTSASANMNKKIAFVQGVQGDEFYITMACGIQSEAQKLGYTVDIQGPAKFDPTLQKPIIDSVIASKPAALLVAPTDITAMQAPLKQAADAGIKVVLVDTTLSDPSLAVAEIASDNEGGGKAAFDAIAQKKPDGGKVLVIGTDPGVSTLDARVKGFETAAKANSKFTYLGVQYSHNDPSTAAQLVTASLQKDPDIVGIFAANLFAAEGSATGVRQSGKTGIVIIGFDAGPNQVKALEAGTVQALIAQQPAEIGVKGVQAADAALTGKTPEKKTQTGFTIITKDNLSGEGGAAVYKSKC